MVQRKSRSNRKMNGGQMPKMDPMSTGGDPALAAASNQSEAQGVQFRAAQHGGQADVNASTMALDGGDRILARMGGLDASYAAAAGQAGGKRRKATRGRKVTRGRKAGRKASRKASRKATRKASRKSGRKASRKANRKLSGGAMLGFAGADSPGMLLSGSQARAALGGMSSEWRMAENPSAFAPK